MGDNHALNIFLHQVCDTIYHNDGLTAAG